MVSVFFFRGFFSVRGSKMPPKISKYFDQTTVDATVIKWCTEKKKLYVSSISCCYRRSGWPAALFGYRKYDYNTQTALLIFNKVAPRFNQSKFLVSINGCDFIGLNETKLNWIKWAWNEQDRDRRISTEWMR